MQWFSLFLSSVVSLYIGIMTIKSFLFYRKCSRYKKTGDYIEIEGEVKSLHDVKKKAINGAMTVVSFPEYTAVFDEKEVNYLSVVKRVNVNVCDKVTLYMNKESEFIWAKNDLKILLKVIAMRLLMILCLAIFVTISFLTPTF